MSVRLGINAAGSKSHAAPIVSVLIARESVSIRFVLLFRIREICEGMSFVSGAS
jgi:hypothetical protein